jgi:hypothetical protein
MVTESELASRVRDELTVAVAAINPDDEFMQSALSQRPRQRWNRPRLVLAAIPIAAGLAVALLVFVAPTTASRQVQNRPAVLVVKLFGQAVRLPLGSRVLSSSASSCQAWLGATHGTVISYGILIPAEEGSSVTVISGNSNVVSAPDGQQSCIQSAISPAYALPPGSTATSPLVPAGDGATPTTVDGDYAETTPATVQSTGPDGSSSATQGTLLYVRVPVGNGQFKLATVLGWSMPANEVVDLASSALRTAK